MQDVDLGEPTSFLDHVNLGCTQRERQISNDIVANYRDIFFIEPFEEERKLTMKNARRKLEVPLPRGNPPHYWKTQE